MPCFPEETAGEVWSYTSRFWTSWQAQHDLGTRLLSPNALEDGGYESAQSSSGRSLGFPATVMSGREAAEHGDASRCASAAHCAEAATEAKKCQRDFGTSRTVGESSLNLVLS